MSGQVNDPRLDALLRELPAPPPFSADLAARVSAAASAIPQEPRPARARRAVARRDRRGRWLGRPLLAGAVGLGLLVSSAVAATLAGIPIPQKLAAVFFPEEKAPPLRQAEPPRGAPRRPPASPSAPVRTAEAAVKQETALPPAAGPWRRLFIAQRIVDARRAMGLPTPGADRIERRLRRRAALWEAATPEQRAQWLERQRMRREARQAALATPEGQAGFAAQQERLRRWRAQRQAGIPLAPGERAALRAWRDRRMTAIPLLTEEERAARQERFRQWRKPRRALWQAQNGEAEAASEGEPEAPEPADR